MGLDELTPEIGERLGEAGLTDSYLMSRKGVVSAEFDRDAESFEAAVRSAMADITRAGVGVTGFRLAHEDAVVSAAEIARKLGKTRQAVDPYISGKRGPGGFPRPVSNNSGEPVYSWAEVADWLESNSMAPPNWHATPKAGPRSTTLWNRRYLASIQPEVAETVTALVGAG